MKKQFVSKSTRVAVLRYGFAFLLLLNLSSAFARPVTKGDEPFVSIKYIGAVEERAQFQVDLIHDNEEAYLFTIQDQDGIVLYKEKVAKKAFTKKFEWNNNDIDASKLVFSITGEKSRKTQVFEVNAQVRTVQDVIINKL